jgi:hypothetical protein
VIEALAFIALMIAWASAITFVAFCKLGDGPCLVVCVTVWTGAVIGIAMIGDVLIGMV